MTVAPPNSPEAEESVLGAVMLSDRCLGPLVSEEGLRPEHFYRPSHQVIFAAMVAIADNGNGVDRLTVIEHLRSCGTLDGIGGEAEVDGLTGGVPAVGNVRQYGRAVIESAAWRRRLTASYEIQSAVESRDEPAYQTAEQRLTLPPEHGVQRSFDRVELGTAVLALLEGGEIETFPWPFHQFNEMTRGGMRRRQVTFISGPTRHGKSVMLDMTLQSAAVNPATRVGLFVNEMSAEERALRVVARTAPLSYTKLELVSAGLADLESPEMDAVMGALNRLPFDVVECAGWSAADICREARRRRLDVVGFDIIQRLPHINQSRVAELEDASNMFDRLAKEGGCHVLICGHINRARAGQTATVPFPTLGDIRDCAAFAHDADNVLFVWREQDEETGDPLDHGQIRFAKLRNGQPGGIRTDFVGDFQEFVPALPTVRPVAA